jgi:glucose/arabinose dehydrogenase
MRQAVTIAAFVGLFASTSLARALPSGFTKSRIASGLSKPTSMAFAPDGRLFITERGTQAGGTGHVRIVKDGALLSTPFVSIPVDDVVITANERGLLGLAIDPGFSSNNFIYVYYTVPGSPPHNRISRFTAVGDVAAPGSELSILDLDDLVNGNHNGGALHFGADGKLYVGVGENHIAANAIDLTNHLGKILRINGDGSAPSDNPFFDAGDGISARDRIWAFGLRNPFTFAVEPSTGRIFVNDVGEATWEEIDDLVKGSDYGWRGGATDGDSTAWYRYDHVAGKAIAGGTFYEPAAPPGAFASYVGQYFFADYTGGWIRVIDPSNKSVTAFETGIGGPLDLDVASDGTLYYLGHTAGEVWQVSASGSVQQGIALSTDLLNATEGSSSTFTVQLAAQPSSNVVVDVAGTSGDPSVTVAPTSLTFTSSNWSAPQTVTASAAEDPDALTGSAVITCSSSGLASQKVVVNAIDNDSNGPAALISAPREGDVVAGTGAEYYGGSNLDGSTVQGEFWVDGVLKYTDVGPGHYHYSGSHASWDTAELREGAHTLRLTVFDATGQSGSHEIHVTVDNLPAPWDQQDVGAVGAVGSGTQSSGVFTVKGSGADVGGTADGMHYVYESLSGDGEIKARIDAIDNVNSSAKAGVMIRETLAAGSKYALMLVMPGGELTFQRRTSTNGTSASTSGGTDPAPVWVRLKRAGSKLTGYKSPDGINWTRVGSASISMTTTALVGMAVTSHADGTLCAASFSNVASTGTIGAAALAFEPGHLSGDDDGPVVSRQGRSFGCGVGGGGGGAAVSSALMVGLALLLRRWRR